MTRPIVERFHPLRISLLGSRARGDAQPRRHVDLLVVPPEATDRRRAMVNIFDILADLPAAKDVVVTTPDEIARRGDPVGTVLRPG